MPFHGDWVQRQRWMHQEEKEGGDLVIVSQRPTDLTAARGTTGGTRRGRSGPLLHFT